MQNDLISRSDAIKRAKAAEIKMGSINGIKAVWMDSVMRFLENLPAVDAVELTEEEAVLLFSVATQIVQDMEVQGRASLYPRKYATFQEIKRKLREHIGERRADDGK